MEFRLKSQWAGGSKRGEREAEVRRTRSGTSRSIQRYMQCSLQDVDKQSQRWVSAVTPRRGSGNAQRDRSQSEAEEEGGEVKAVVAAAAGVVERKGVSSLPQRRRVQ